MPNEYSEFFRALAEADDPLNEIEIRCNSKNKWVGTSIIGCSLNDITRVVLDRDCEWRIKPKNIRVTVERPDGEKRTFELPEPMREAPGFADDFWSVFLTLQTNSVKWNGGEYNFQVLKAGNCFATEADAKAWAECQRFMRGVSDD